MASVATALRVLREARRLSVAEAARRAGVSRATIHQWENGVHAPPGPALERLLAALRAGPGDRATLLAAADPRHAQDALADDPLGAPVSRGAILRAMRLRRDLTQGAVARAMGTTQSAVAKWESGDNAPGEETHARLMAVLGATEEEGAMARNAGETDERLGIEETRVWANTLFKHGDGTALEPLLLAHEAEMWRRATRDPAWEPALISAMGMRAGWLLGVPDRTAESLALAHRALDLAARRGMWDDATNPFNCLLMHRFDHALEDPRPFPEELMRGLRRSESLMARTKSPGARSVLLSLPPTLIAAELRNPGSLRENARWVEDAIANRDAPSFFFGYEAWEFTCSLTISLGFLGRLDEVVEIDETTDWSAAPDGGVFRRAMNLHARMWSYLAHEIAPSADEVRRFEANAPIYAPVPSMRHSVRDWHRKRESRKLRRYV